MSFESDMQLLVGKMKQLEIEYEQWFSGALPRPPWETKKVVENIVQKYNRNPPDRLADRSVFQMHQSKFNTYSEMWERRTRLKEEGRLPGGQELRPRRSRVAKSAEPTPRQEGGRFKDVFDSYLAAKQGAGQATDNLKYESFRRQLEKQAEALKNKRGYDVDFAVSTKGGKISLVARRKK